MQGHHVYKCVWSPVIGEVLQHLQGGGDNDHDAQPPLLGYFFSRSNLPRAIRQPPRIRV